MLTTASALRDLLISECLTVLLEYINFLSKNRWPFQVGNHTVIKLIGQ